MYKTVNEPIQQNTAVNYESWLRRTAMNHHLYQTVTHYYSLLSEAKYNLSLTSTAAGCVHSFGSLNGVAIGVEGLIFQEEGEVNLISCTQRCVNNQSQTVCLKLFFVYYLFSLLLAITNF